MAHADHCQTLAVSARTVGKQQPTTHRSTSLQDDDDYWQKTNTFIADEVTSLLAEITDPKPPADEKPAEATSGSQNPTPAAGGQSSAPNATSQPQESAAAPTADVDVKPLSDAVLNGIGAELGLIRQFINQKISAREAELARASLPATPAPPPVRKLYCLESTPLPDFERATNSQTRS